MTDSVIESVEIPNEADERRRLIQVDRNFTPALSPRCCRCGTEFPPGHYAAVEYANPFCQDCFDDIYNNVNSYGKYDGGRYVALRKPFLKDGSA